MPNMRPSKYLFKIFLLFKVIEWSKNAKSIFEAFQKLSKVNYFPNRIHHHVFKSLFHCYSQRFPQLRPRQVSIKLSFNINYKTFFKYL